jgi:preprotein translocase subunit SecG
MDKALEHNNLMGRISDTEELILFGTHQCAFDNGGGGVPLLNAVTWILTTVWEVLALCLAAWIVIKHVRELQRTSTGSSIGDCFRVLIKTHVFYFAL